MTDAVDHAAVRMAEARRSRARFAIETRAESGSEADEMEGL
jgi:hypothetical protein